MGPQTPPHTPKPDFFISPIEPLWIGMLVHNIFLQSLLSFVFMAATPSSGTFTRLECHAKFNWICILIPNTLHIASYGKSCKKLFFINSGLER